MKVKCNKKGIQAATEIIRNGGVAIYPTDTVYGIGCDPFNRHSIKKIYQIKKREKTKSLPILTYSINLASEIAEFDKTSKTIAERFWPGPLTLILKLKNMKLQESMNVSKIAIRVPNNSCLLDLLKNSKFLIGTSANISGEEPFTKSEECYKKMTGYDIFLDGGDIAKNGVSTVLEINGNKLTFHRIGVIKKKEIAELL